MPGSNPSEAFNAFYSPLQRAVACVTREHLIGGNDSRRPGGRRTLAFARPGPVLLGGSHELGFTVSFDYEIIETGEGGRQRYRVRTLGYKHQIVTGDFEEVVLFHWHPREAEREDIPSRPHIHVGSALLADKVLLTRRAHLPSGRVALEDVVEFSITELDASPRQDDWADVLDRARRLFEQYRTWGGRGLPDTDV